ncbi:serine hydrolase [Natronorarus salvus]|uniref:serine hydrolase n=1 Tax=Natronorarus salvus TaxID=3117733 RepID=UPI002F2624DF
MSLSSERTTEIDRVLDRWMIDEGVPGASVAVLTGDEIGYTAGYGSRDLASNAPATPDTLYGIGSVTKSFTALSALQLVERDELSLDEPIGTYLDREGLPEATVHDLLTHSSGMPSLAVSEALLSRQAGMEEAGVPLGDREDFYRHLRGAREEWAGTPEGRFMYSNSGYMLVADAVSEIDGRPFAQVVEEEILSPLGMERSTFSEERFEADPDTMTPYELTDEGVEERSLPIRELSQGPGGLLSSVVELASYLRLQLGGGAVDGERIVSAALLARAHEGHTETPVGPYGYGWRTREVAGERVIGHGGSIGVATAYLGFLPDREMGVAVLCNTGPGYSTYALAQEVVAAALGEDPDEVAERVRRRRMDRLCGEYETYRGIKRARVERQGEGLVLTFEDAFGGAPLPLVPEDERLAGYRFTTPAASGVPQSVLFEVSGEEVDCYVDRWRLHRQ